MYDVYLQQRHKTMYSSFQDIQVQATQENWNWMENVSINRK